MFIFGNILEKRIDFGVPNYREDTIRNLFSSHNDCGPDAKVLEAHTRFVIEELQIDGEIMLFFDLGAFDEFLASVRSMVD